MKKNVPPLSLKESVCISFKRLANLCAIPLIATTVSLTGCASMGSSGYPTYAKDIANKTIRVEVVEPEYSKDAPWYSAESKGPGLVVRNNWGDYAKQFRWVFVWLHTGTWHYSGYQGASYVAIADHFPYLSPGDIVDVQFIDDYLDADYEKFKVPKVVRVVCHHKDKACIKRIKSENEWGAVTGYPVPPVDTSGFTYTPNKPADKSKKDIGW